MDEPKFIEFPKIARLSRECVITEKLDGTNASIYIAEDGLFCTGSRTRWITPDEDNYGFSKWAHDNMDELMKLGPGHHFGEWWGTGIQRGYGLREGEKRWSLFNTHRWGGADRPACCHVTPVLFTGMFGSTEIDMALDLLREEGSVASPGFMRAEGIVIYHRAANICFKKTIEKDDEYKGKTNEPVAS